MMFPLATVQFFVQGVLPVKKDLEGPNEAKSTK